MACSKPLRAWRLSSGSVVIGDRPNDYVSEFTVPCAQCQWCRLERSRQWAVRCMHESKMHKSNCFVTLTYDEESCPGSLRYKDYQLFMRRLRKQIGDVRFYMCGEYGPKLSRPHFHSNLFGLSFDDRVYWKSTESGAKLYRSPTLERLWPYGFSTVGDLTFETAAYTARYCMSKMTGSLADRYYGDKVPEFNVMSRRPGIGRGFFDKYRTDMYPHDYVVVNNKETKPPRYYDKIMDQEFPDVFRDVALARELAAWDCRDDNTPERLAVKNEVLVARIRSLKRSLYDV